MSEKDRYFDATPEFFGAKLATRNLHPIAELSAENCTEQMGVLGPWYERLPHFRMGFTPSAGKELQSEYFVPRQHADGSDPGGRATARSGRSVSVDHGNPNDRRRQSMDEHLLPASQCDHPFHLEAGLACRQKLLPVIEKELSPFNARPHWGKLFTISPAELKRIYKKMPDFIALSNQYDPHGKFRNEYLNKNIFNV